MADDTDERIGREKIGELRRLCEDATPGPWKWWTSNSWRRLKHDDRGKTQNVLEPYVCRDGHPDCIINEPDMAFIAAAREYLPALLSLASQGEWRPIESAPKAPVDSPECLNVLAYYPDGPTVVMYWADGWWPDANDSGVPWSEPTHWMPLPAPPKDAPPQLLLRPSPERLREIASDDMEGDA